MRKIVVLIIVFALFMAQGCAVNVYKKSLKDRTKIQKLSTEMGRLQELMEKERKQFKGAKKELEKKLKTEIGRMEIGLELEDRGLVITMSDSILFDSGEADIKKEAHSVLDKVIDVANARIPDKNIGVEGHTDNVPITHSGWKSNWELSTARATSVLHYLVGVGGIDPARLSATGYGEYRPIATNETQNGKARNRRVEIVILPQYSKKSIRELKAAEKGFKEEEGLVK